MLKYNMIRYKSLRFLKIFIVLSCIIIFAYFSFFRQSINEKLEKICDLQVTMSKLLHQKMRYMSKINFPNKDEWVSVIGINGYIFSAYLELRPEVIVTNSVSESDLPWAQVRIIAILPLDITDTNQVDCIFKLTTKEQSIYQRQSAKIQLFKDNWNFKYSASFIICDLIYQNNLQDELLVKELPESVGIISKSLENLSSISFIDIYYPKNGFNQHQKWTKKKSIALCVPNIIHRNFNRTLELIQFIEYYRMIGINHFTFYKSSVSQQVGHILEFYQNMNIATVLSWHLSSIYIDDKQTLRLQRLSSVLDCHYRNSFYNDYEYIGIFDIDEFLILKRHNSLIELLKYLDPSILSQEYSEYTSFSFRNFYPNAEKIHFNSELLNLQTRVIPRKLHMSWSRYLVRAQDVTVLDHQFIELQLNQNFLRNSMNKRFKEMIVDPAVAFLHYYAPSETENTGYYVKSMEIDAMVQKLSKIVVEVCSLMFEGKKCPPPERR